MKIPFQTPVLLESRLPMAEVSLRLSNAVLSPYAFFKSYAKYPVAGSVGARGCSLRPRTFYNNSFQRLLKLTFEEVGGTTRMEGKFAVNPFVIAFMALWISVLGLLSAIMLAAYLFGAFHTPAAAASGHGSDSNWPFAFAPPGMLLFGVAMVRFGLWLSKRNEQTTLAYVERVAEARSILPADSAASLSPDARMDNFNGSSL